MDAIGRSPWIPAIGYLSILGTKLQLANLQPKPRSAGLMSNPDPPLGETVGPGYAVNEEESEGKTRQL